MLISRNVQSIFLLVDASERLKNCYEDRVNVILSELQSLIYEWVLGDDSDFPTTDFTTKIYYFKDLAKGYTTLNSRLSSRADFSREVDCSYFAPIIILISDGKQVESIVDYMSALNTLKANNWFKAAVRIAINLGVDGDNLVLSEFTMNSESILNIHSVSDLRHMFRNPCHIRVSGVLEESDNDSLDWDDW